MPPNGIVTGTIYPDGSVLDGPHKQTGRTGWAFTAPSDDGNITARANGVPPQGVDDSHGAEVWAVIQAAEKSMPGSALV